MYVTGLKVLDFPAVEDSDILQSAEGLRSSNLGLGFRV